LGASDGENGLSLYNKANAWQPQKRQKLLTTSERRITSGINAAESALVTTENVSELWQGEDVHVGLRVVDLARSNDTAELGRLETTDAFSGIPSSSEVFMETPNHQSTECSTPSPTETPNTDRQFPELGSAEGQQDGRVQSVQEAGTIDDSILGEDRNISRLEAGTPVTVGATQATQLFRARPSLDCLEKGTERRSGADSSSASYIDPSPLDTHLLPGTPVSLRDSPQPLESRQDEVINMGLRTADSTQGNGNAGSDQSEMHDYGNITEVVGVDTPALTNVTSQAEESPNSRRVECRLQVSTGVSGEVNGNMMHRLPELEQPTGNMQSSRFMSLGQGNMSQLKTNIQALPPMKPHITSYPHPPEEHAFDRGIWPTNTPGLHSCCTQMPSTDANLDQYVHLTFRGKIYQSITYRN
jgi:hypothetical protein